MTMSKAERDELAKLVRRREKLAKADADRVAAERLADFEHQLATIYKPADDPVWQEVHAATAAAVDQANAEIQARCDELRIPVSCRPILSRPSWYGRSAEHMSAERRAELRAVAKTRIDADVKATKAEIERRSVEVQTELLAGGLRSDEARAFLATMPTAEELMPGIPSVEEIEAETGTPPTGCRQRMLA